MALDAVVFPQDLFDCSMKDLCGYDDIGDLLMEFDDDQGKELGKWGVDLVSSSKENGGELEVVVERLKKKRWRTNSSKNKEEVENQRMTHIAVEWNRRKLMNEHLSELRSIMPPAYVYRGDQASTVGGAINLVKELEQLLQTLEAQRRNKNNISILLTHSNFLIARRIVQTKQLIPPPPLPLPPPVTTTTTTMQPKPQARNIQQ